MKKITKLKKNKSQNAIQKTIKVGTLSLLLLAGLISFMARAQAADFYWVGGTTNAAAGSANQNYGNIANWSSSSGGPSNMTQLPNNGDNIIFDRNSFGTTPALQTVTINQTSKCDDMTFVSSGPNAITVNPILNINNPLEVNGSLQLIASMTVNGASTITLNSVRSAETLNLAGATFNSNLTLTGTAKWTVVGNLSLDYTGTGSQGLFTYSNPNSLVINGNLRSKGVVWGDGNTATRDSLTVNGNVNIYSIAQFSFTDGGVLKVTGDWGGTTTGYGGIVTFRNSEKIEFLGDVSTSNMTFTDNTGGIAAANSLSVHVFTFNANGGGLSVGTELSAGAFRFTSTNSQNITVGTSQRSESVRFISDGNYTVGATGFTGDVLTTTGINSTGIVVLDGSGTKTFNGNLRLNNGLQASGGTINIHGSLHVGSFGLTSVATSGSHIQNGAILTVNGNVTGGGYFCIYNPATVNITGAFTQSFLEIFGGTTTIGSGPINLTGYWNEYGHTNSLNISAGTLTFSNPQTINCTGNFTQTGGVLTLNNPQTITVGQNFSTNAGTLTGLGGSTVNLGYHWTYSGTQSVTLTAAIAPRLIRIQYAGLTTRSADRYNNVIFYDHSAAHTHTLNSGIYNKVTVLSGASSYDNTPVTDSLIINSRNRHTFVGTTTVNRYLEIKPTTCGGTIPVEDGIISMGNPSVVNVENVQLSNQTINGPAGTYTAANSIDNGGNTNWNFTSSIQTYYWTGGTGDWDDPLHWSVDPSPARAYPGNGCVPTLYDNVVFDQYSGLNGSQTITTTATS